MRNAILLLFLIIGVLCAAVLYGPTVSLIPDAMANPSLEDLPPNLQEDVAFLLSNEAPRLTVSFSHKEFFYSETIYVSIYTNTPAAAIYYTTDGSEPTETSDRFTHPLEFTAEEAVKCNVLKAIAIDGAQQSAVLTHSYFVGVSVNLRFTTYVFSISSEPDGLYGYENGILVPGKIYDDYMAITPEEEIPDKVFRRPANYIMRGREWERHVYVEAFTDSGDRVLSQNAGMRVHGNSSRIRAQKSLRLTARREYESEHGRFHYGFFDDFLGSDVFETPILSHDALILRNDGSEFYMARLRNPLASWIAREIDFAAVSPYSAAAVFINGEYYGYATLNRRMDHHFLQDLYNAPERSFDIVDGEDHEVTTDDENIINEFAKLLEYAQGGFDDYEIQFLHEYFDVDNLLLYYAFQTYIANRDWSGSNITRWRYTGPADRDYLADELDGRWRFLLWDLDLILYEASESSPNRKSITRLLDGDLSPIFETLIERPEYAEKFANHVCDMATEHFSLINVQQVISELDAMNIREQVESLLLHERELDEFLQLRENIITFAEQRPDYILAELRELFGYTDMYRIVSDGTAKINTLNGGEGVYFIENRVSITPVLKKGCVFDHWLINGEKRYDENLLVSFGDADADGVVFVQAVSREDFPPLLFSDTYDTGTLFGFTMYNPNSATQNTQGLYLSDDIDELQKWQFPALNIRPGSTWEFVGRNSTSLDSLLKIGLNFNPRHGEVVFLSNEDGIILDWIAMKP